MADEIETTIAPTETPTLTQAQVDEIVTKRLAVEKQRQNALNAQLLAEQTQRQKLEADLAAIQNKGKSAEQLAAEAALRYEAQVKALQGEVAQREAQAQELRGRLMQTHMDAQVQRHLSSAVNPARAALLAKVEIPGLSVDETTLELTYTNPKTGLTADPAKVLGDWLRASPDLLRAAPGGPPTKGTAPPADPPPKGPLDGIPPGAKQIAAAFAMQGRR